MTDPFASSPSDRKKTSYLTNNFVEVTGSNGEESGMFNQSSLLTRMVVNGNDEVTYLAIAPGGSEGAWIYEGGGVMRNIWHFNKSQYAKGWEMVTGPDGTAGVNVLPETTYGRVASEHGLLGKDSRPFTVRNDQGIEQQYEQGTGLENVTVRRKDRRDVVTREKKVSREKKCQERMALSKSSRRADWSMTMVENEIKSPSSETELSL